MFGLLGINCQHVPKDAHIRTKLHLYILSAHIRLSDISHVLKLTTVTFLLVSSFVSVEMT